MSNVLPLQKVDPLRSLQTKFALYQGGGDVWLVQYEDIAKYQTGASLKPPELYRRAPAELLIKRYVQLLPFTGNVKALIADFWVDPNTHVFDEIAFSPLTKPPSTLNLWIGVPIPPKPGNWYQIRRHLFEVICGSDRRVLSYLLRYLAHAIQYPHEKPGVMIVLLGKQGIGKGLFFQLLDRIWPRSTLLVSDIDQVVGRFNSALATSFIACLDEALFAGDRKSQDRMKSLITEPTIHIEQKYQPARTIESYHRFFAASNHEHFAHIEQDDRRTLVLNVADQRLGDYDYFEGLHREIRSDDAIAAFIYTLQQIDLTGFNVFQRPATRALDEQKLKSLTRLERYWHQMLYAGVVYPNDDFGPQWTDGVFITTSGLVSGLKAFDPNTQRYKPVSVQEVADTVKTLCPSATAARKTQNNGSPRRGYTLPNLDTARREFANAKGIKIDWPEVSEEEK